MTLLGKEKYPMRERDNNDSNYLAYREALESGQLSVLEPGTFVVFFDGELRLIASGVDLDRVMDILDKMKVGKCLIKRINIPERIVMLPQIVAEGVARRRARIGPGRRRRG